MLLKQVLATWLLFYLALLFHRSAHACRDDDVIETPREKENMQLKISMPQVKTTYSDQYICYAHPLDSIGDAFVLRSLTEADRSTVHHVATGVCEEPASISTIWDCTQSQGLICKGDAVNFGGWDEFTKKNGVFQFPQDVSLRVGNSTKLKYFIIEIHFMDPIDNPQYPVANVTIDFVHQPTKLNYQTYSFINTGLIPANMEKGFFSDAACLWKRPPALAYRYFLHTHHYGILVEGFLVRNGTWTLLGSQLSLDKKKDLYDIPGGPIEIRPGDIVASRCLYINGKDKPIKFGMSEGEEMCNFQLDLGYDPKFAEEFRRPPTCRARSPEFTFCDHKETQSIC